MTNVLPATTSHKQLVDFSLLLNCMTSKRCCCELAVVPQGCLLMDCHLVCCPAVHDKLVLQKSCQTQSTVSCILFRFQKKSLLLRSGIGTWTSTVMLSATTGRP